MRFPRYGSEEDVVDFKEGTQLALPPGWKWLRLSVNTRSSRFAIAVIRDVLSVDESSQPVVIFVVLDWTLEPPPTIVLRTSTTYPKVCDELQNLVSC